MKLFVLRVRFTNVPRKQLPLTQRFTPPLSVSTPTVAASARTGSQHSVASHDHTYLLPQKRRPSNVYDEEHERGHRPFDVSEGLNTRPFYWTTALQSSFRKELTRCVIFCVVCRFEHFILVQACHPGLPDVEHRPWFGKFHDPVLGHLP